MYPGPSLRVKATPEPGGERFPAPWQVLDELEHEVGKQTTRSLGSMGTAEGPLGGPSAAVELD
jgi:hypothetical protein